MLAEVTDELEDELDPPLLKRISEDELDDVPWMPSLIIFNSSLGSIVVKFCAVTIFIYSSELMTVSSRVRIASSSSYEAALSSGSFNISSKIFEAEAGAADAGAAAPWWI